MTRRKRESSETEKASGGEWVKAIKPGTTPSGKFIKAGDKFQLEADHPFSDSWMERTDAPEQPEADPKFLEEQQRRDLATHEEQDKARRGKFTFSEVPRKEDVQPSDDESKSKRE